MNSRSLAHNYTQNQQPSSWIDDPFQLGAHIINGLKPMDNQQNLSTYAEELVYQFGKYQDDQYSLNLFDLSEYDQNELARLYMETTDRETGECVHGNDFSIDNDYTCALLAMLKNNCLETQTTFAEITRKNIITYYAKSLQTVLDDACNDLQCHFNEEQGFSQQQDRESGEVFWGRF